MDSRRNNIIVGAVPETPDETGDQCETLLKENICSKLGMKGDRVNDRVIGYTSRDFVCVYIYSTHRFDIL